jgi:hypothetical protein
LPGLIAVGAVLIALFIAGLVLTRTVGSETTEKTTAPPAGASATTPTDKTTKAKSFPSDTILTALLSAGGALLLVGALYGRLTSIKVFGAEFGLAPAETDKVAEKVAEKLKGEPAEKVAEALPKAFEHARREKRAAEVATLSGPAIDAAAAVAVDSVT